MDANKCNRGQVNGSLLAVPKLIKQAFMLKLAQMKVLKFKSI